jgi:homoserine trans-succinylase
MAFARYVLLALIRELSLPSVLYVLPGRHVLKAVVNQPLVKLGLMPEKVQTRAQLVLVDYSPVLVQVNVVNVQLATIVQMEQL